MQSTVAKDYPDWTDAELSRQWEDYVKKGQRGNKWEPTRRHFLNAWMPKAERPERRLTARKPKPPHPDDELWREFVKETGEAEVSRSARSERQDKAFREWKHQKQPNQECAAACGSQIENLVNRLTSSPERATAAARSQ